jgi:hypothetical protein
MKKEKEKDVPLIVPNMPQSIFSSPITSEKLQEMLDKWEIEHHGEIPQETIIGSILKLKKAFKEYKDEDVKFIVTWTDYEFRISRMIKHRRGYIPIIEMPATTDKKSITKTLANWLKGE